MTCSEFQKVLPYVIETGGNAEEEGHLKSCAVCSDLVQDLRYIAEQAKLLVPMEDPSPRVWSGIQNALEREGLVRPARGTARFRPAANLIPGRRGAVGGLLVFAALLLVATGLIIYRNRAQQAPAAEASKPANPGAQQTAAAVDDDDVQLLQAVQAHAPAVLATYQDNLSSVNAYIADAKQRVEQNPDDEQARDYLISAYNEKAMLYEMATSRSLE